MVWKLDHLVKEIPEEFQSTYYEILENNGLEEANYALSSYLEALGYSTKMIESIFSRHAQGGIVSLNQMTRPIGYR